jgi:hypothetical protein
MPSGIAIGGAIWMMLSMRRQKLSASQNPAEETVGL